MSARDELADLELTSRDADFVRLEYSQIDQWVDELLEELDEASRDEVENFRRGLDADGAAVLDLAARRMVVRYLRESDLALARRSLIVFSLLPTPAFVPWETWLKGLLYLVREDQGGVEDVTEDLAAWAEESWMDRFAIALDALERIRSLGEVHLVITECHHGLGLLELALSPAGSMASTQISSIQSTGLAGGAQSDAPDEEESGFGAESDLVGLCVALAEGIDEREVYVSSEIRHDQIPATLFELDFAEPFLPAVGVLSFAVVDESGDEIYTVYVGELFADEDVEEWGECAGDDVAVVTRDRRLVVFMLSPFTEETVEVFDDQLDVAAQLLEEWSPTDWAGEVSIFVDDPDSDDTESERVNPDDADQDGPHAHHIDLDVESSPEMDWAHEEGDSHD